MDSGPGGGREGEHRKSVVSVRNSMSRCVRVLDFEEEFHAVPSKPVRQGSVSYTHLTLPTRSIKCRSRWSPYH